MSSPVICLYGPAAGPDAVARIKASVPEGVPVVAAKGPSGLPLGSLVHALAARLGKRNLVLLSASVSVPPLWLPRLMSVLDAEPALGAVCPLSAGELGVSEWVADDDALTLFDQRLYHLSERRFRQQDHIQTACVLIRNPVVANAGRGEDLEQVVRRSGLVVARCEHLLIADGDRSHDCGEPEDPRLKTFAAQLQHLQQLGLPGGPALDQPQQVILHLVHGWGGGTERWVNDLAKGDGKACHLILRAQADPDHSLAATGYDLYLAHSSGIPLRSWPLTSPIADTGFNNLAARAIVEEIFTEFSVNAVMVSSLIGHDIAVLDSGLPTTVVLHDYYPFCPALNIYFDEVCTSCKPQRLERCLKTNPNNQLFSERQPRHWLKVREQFAKRLKRGEIQLVAPTRTVANAWRRLEEAFDPKRCRVIPHGIEHWDRTLSDPAEVKAGERLRVVVVGRIRGGKGLALLMSALNDLTEDADIYLLGCGKEGETFFGRSRVNIILNYERAELPDHLECIRPHLALLPSTVPETFSYTLSELWSLGLPVMATDIGSFSERIQNGENGWLVAPQPAAMVGQVRELRRNPDRIAEVRANLAQRQATSLADMAASYREFLPRPSERVLDHAPRLSQPRGLAIALLSAQIQTLKDSLLDLQATAEQRQVELHRRAQWVTDLEDQNTNRLQWVRSLETELEKTREDFDSLQDDFDERTRWVNQLQQEVADARHQFQLGQMQLREHEKEVEKARASEAQAISESQQLAQRLEEIESSTIWRITAPIRIVGTWIKTRIRATRGGANLARVRRSIHMRGYRETLALVRKRMTREKSMPAEFKAVELDEPVTPFEMPNATTPKVSIVIPVYNQIQHTYACLRSIAAHQHSVPMEVIVVDDCSSDESEELLPQFEGLRYLRNEQNLGFIGACNAGAELAAGDYILFLNNDTTVSAGWLEALVETFAQFSDCGLVGARLVYPDGRLQEAGGIVFSDASGWNYGRFEDPGDPRFSYAREADYCSGACIMLARELFEELGGFDDHYAPAYYEDTDLAFKVREFGLKVMVQPACSIIHYEGVTSGTDTSSGTKRYQVINQEKFAERWRDALTEQPQPGGDIELAKEFRTQRRVLVIDACVPTPDQDSGSVRMTYLLRLLRSLGYKVSFVAENLRYEGPYTERLQALGIEMLYEPFVSNTREWLEQNGAHLDLVLVSRHYIASQFMQEIHEFCPNAKIIFDTVDLHYLREQRQAELEESDALLKQARKTKESELGVARSAHHTLVVSPVEAEELAESAPTVSVSVLSNIHLVHGCRVPFDQRRDLFFVGGFQHPPNVDAVLWFAEAVWPKVQEQLGDVVFHVVGSRAPGSINRLDIPGVEVHGYVEDLAPFLDGCRIAIAPLRYGAGVKGKVNMSMSYGQPVVATTVAMEGMHSEDGEDVLVADEAEEFAQAVVRLYQNEALWSRLSAGGLENVRRHFSLDAARASLQCVLDALDLPYQGSEAGSRED